MKFHQVSLRGIIYCFLISKIARHRLESSKTNFC